MGLFNEVEQKYTIALDLESDCRSFAEALGTFIRNMYATSDNEFALCAIDGTFAEDGKPMESISSTTLLPGNKTVYELLSAFTGVEIDMRQFVNLDVRDNKKVNDNINVKRLSSSIFELSIEFTGSILDSSALGGLCKKDKIILEDFDGKKDIYSLYLYFKYGCGKYEIQDLGIEFSALGLSPVIQSVYCIKKGNVGWKVIPKEVGQVLEVNLTKDVIHPEDFEKSLVNVRDLFNNLIKQLNK